MGLYINSLPALGSLPAKGKARFLLEAVDGVEEIQRPEAWQPNLVCVVENALFDAAAYCDTPEEFKEFSDPRDPRPKVWLLVPYAYLLAH